jgi:hypothetical protein
MAKTKGLTLSSVEAAGMTIKQRAIHYYWGDNAGHPAFRHAMTIHTVRKLADETDSRGGPSRTAAALMKQHKLFNDAIEAIVAAVARGESSFFEVFADAVRRFKKPTAANAVRWEAARYVLECDAKGTVPTRESTIRNVRVCLGDAHEPGIESAIDRMRLFSKTVSAATEKGAASERSKAPTNDLAQTPRPVLASARPAENAVAPEEYLEAKRKGRAKVGR